MNSSRQLRIRQDVLAQRASNCDSHALFNLLTSDALFDTVEQLLPEHRERLYTPTQTLSMFLTQALHSDHSCQRIVNEEAVARACSGMGSQSSATGGYCRARQRLPLTLPRELVRFSAQHMIRHSPSDWLWQARSVKLVDGTTLSMPDTPANQDVFPQPRSQQPGLGFPICRLVGLMSLGCGALIDVAYGPYQGKSTGEQALLRSLLHNLERNDVLLGDAFYGTYFLLWELQRRGVDGVFEQLGGRKKATDFRRGLRLGKRDHIVRLKRPEKPDWMSQSDYADVPRRLSVRELCTQGKGSKTLVTTLLDSKTYSKGSLKQLYRDRWQVELNFRHIKTTMGLDVLRCKTPEMVEKEIWVALLAYNLVRLLMAQSAILNQCFCSQLSFKHTVQLWLAWTVRAHWCNEAMLFDFIAQRTVGNRPNRFEPRVVKRRPKKYPRMQQPRDKLRVKIERHGHPPIVK